MTCDGTNEFVQTGNSDGQKIKCPDLEDFCGLFEKRCPYDCSGHGLCMGTGKCFCFSGFSGHDCNTCENCSEVID